MYRLYRDHTKLEKGKYIKDIEQLNRDPKKVIMVDINPDAYSLQPENGLKLKSWKGEPSDRELIKFETLLEGNFIKFYYSKVTNFFYRALSLNVFNGN
jgi:import inner membrane translocase subunit TIM50